ncbi:hypothetical protein [Paenibacillus sp. GbtcB18]|nr:hypothetical protein [Paenibacillus sp. GbtcB18]
MKKNFFTFVLLSAFVFSVFGSAAYAKHEMMDPGGGTGSMRPTPPTPPR